VNGRPPATPVGAPAGLGRGRRQPTSLGTRRHRVRLAGPRRCGGRFHGRTPEPAAAHASQAQKAEHRREVPGVARSIRARGTMADSASGQAAGFSVPRRGFDSLIRCAGLVRLVLTSVFQIEDAGSIPAARSVPFRGCSAGRGDRALDASTTLVRLQPPRSHSLLPQLEEGIRMLCRKVAVVHEAVPDRVLGVFPLPKVVRLVRCGQSRRHPPGPPSPDALHRPAASSPPAAVPVRPTGRTPDSGSGDRGSNPRPGAHRPRSPTAEATVGPLELGHGASKDLVRCTTCRSSSIRDIVERPSTSVGPQRLREDDQASPRTRHSAWCRRVTSDQPR
jgi:hypothetical protein